MSVDKRALIALVVVGLVGCLVPPPAHAAFCNQINTINNSSTTRTLTNLSDRPVRVCSVEFRANAAAGVAVLWDTPDDTTTNSQAQAKAEPGADAVGGYASENYGEEGRNFRFGLDVEVVSGTVIIQWAGAGP